MSEQGDLTGGIWGAHLPIAVTTLQGSSSYHGPIADRSSALKVGQMIVATHLDAVQKQVMETNIQVQSD